MYFCALIKKKNMFNKNIKLVIAAIIALWAVYEFTQIHIMNGISILLLAGIFVFFYFKNEFILLAFMQLRKQNFEGAKKWLDYIKNPSTALIQKQEGYYNYLHGIMLSQTNITQAEKFLRKSVKLGLAMDHDLAMAKLQLAGIAMTKRRKREATNLMAEAKKVRQTRNAKRTNANDETANEENLILLIYFLILTEKNAKETSFKSF
jgi:Ca2+/Na+ antiporter